MTQTLKEMEARLTQMRAEYEAELGRVRDDALFAIRQMLESGTLNAEDLRKLLPAPNPNRRKPGPKPKQQEAA